MPRDRAVVWMIVVLLMTFGIIMGQMPAVMVAAMAGICIAYEQMRRRPERDGQQGMPHSPSP